MSEMIIAKSGPYEGLIFAFEQDSNEWVLGKDPVFSDFFIDDEGFVERQIIFKRMEDGTISMTNLNPGKAKIAVNGAPVQDSNALLLKKGDQLTIGDTLFGFEEEDEDSFEFEEDDDDDDDEDLVGGFFQDEQNSGQKELDSSKNKSTDPVEAEEKQPLKKEEQEALPKVENQTNDVNSVVDPVNDASKANVDNLETADVVNNPKEEVAAAEVKTEPVADPVVSNENIVLEEEKEPIQPVEKEIAQQAEEVKPVVYKFASDKDLDFDNMAKDSFAVFSDVADSRFSLDLTQNSRFLLKVISGPNIGAEFALDVGKKYVMGTSTVAADIIFNDLSVSSKHAVLTIDKDNTFTIEDLGSRNGVLISNVKKEGVAVVKTNDVVSLGTTLFVLIDKEAISETISPVNLQSSFSIAATPESNESEVKESGKVSEAVEAAKKANDEKLEIAKEKKEAAKRKVKFFAVVGCFVMFFGFLSLSLLNDKDVKIVSNVDTEHAINEAIKGFDGVRYTYNNLISRLFLVGHVKSGEEHSELIYKLGNLPWIKSLDDNIVEDDLIWQEMNKALASRPSFKGVSMYAIDPGKFVLSGYISTEEMYFDLLDYINLNFNYISLLTNEVIVEQTVKQEVVRGFEQKGLGSVIVTFINGEIALTGYVGEQERSLLDQQLKEMKSIKGIRAVKNFAVVMQTDTGVVDLDKRYPGRYKVTGKSTFGGVNINVVVNGKILTRGDTLDDMIVTGIQNNKIFLEKDGIKYKISY